MLNQSLYTNPDNRKFALIQKFEFTFMHLNIKQTSLSRANETALHETALSYIIKGNKRINLPAEPMILPLLALCTTSLPATGTVKEEHTI